MALSEKQLNLSAGVMSVTVALILVLAKLWAFHATSSLSIAATLADSALDLLVSAGGLLAIAYAARPADEDHAFGHTSAEDLAALTQALVITASAVAIALSAIERLQNPAPQMAAQGIGIGVMILSIVLTLALVAWQRHVAKRTGNKVVAGDMLHYLGDLIPNFGAIIALLASLWFAAEWLDPLIAIFAAFMMLRGAWEIGKKAWDALMDRSAEPEVIAAIEAEIAKAEGVLGYHDLKTRMSGSYIFVNLHIEMDGEQTLDEAHRKAAALRRAIVRAVPKADVMIHKDPIGVVPHPDDERRA